MNDPRQILLMRRPAIKTFEGEVPAVDWCVVMAHVVSIHMERGRIAAPPAMVNATIEGLPCDGGQVLHRVTAWRNWAYPVQALCVTPDFALLISAIVTGINTVNKTGPLTHPGMLSIDLCGSGEGVVKQLPAPTWGEVRSAAQADSPDAPYLALAHDTLHGGKAAQEYVAAVAARMTKQVTA